MLGKGKTMSPIDEKVIELSKKKIFLLILGSCVFVAVGAWMLSLDEATIQSQRRFSNPLLVHGLKIVKLS